MFQPYCGTVHTTELGSKLNVPVQKNEYHKPKYVSLR